jgi:hypothetical protein
MTLHSGVQRGISLSLHPEPACGEPVEPSKDVEGFCCCS